MDTKLVGDISEAFIAAELLKTGVSVSKPMGDNQRYDLVVYTNQRFYRVQCKTAGIEENGAISFPTCSTYAHRGHGRKNYLGDTEFIMAYCPQTNRVYWERVTEDTPTAKKTLSINVSKNVKNQTFAVDRTLDKIVWF